MKAFKKISLSILSLVFSQTLYGASPPPSTSPSPAATPNIQAEVKKDNTATVVWDSWYTVTLRGKVPYGYYNDRFEKKDGKVAFKNQFWKSEEGFINEERVVAFAKDDADLNPLLFLFTTSYRNTEIAIDGNVSEKRELIVKPRENGKSLSPIRKNVPKKTILSTFFPVWLGKTLPTLKEGGSASFSALLEDNLEKRYSPVTGRVRLEKDDSISKKTGTKKIFVDFADKKNYWYVLPSGEPVRIEMPSQNVVVERTTEAIARRFLLEKDVE